MSERGSFVKQLKERRTGRQARREAEREVWLGNEYSGGRRNKKKRGRSYMKACVLYWDGDGEGRKGAISYKNTF